MELFKSKRLNSRREGFKTLNLILENKSKAFIIHYSCESFITSHGNTPRVTSICIKNISTGQVKSFSIHLQAQFDNKDFKNITDQDYDSIEKNMLNAFSKYVSKHKSHKWIHWNMRDSNYGFEAINNRIKILGGKQFEIEDDLKIDFPQVLGKIFTFGYEMNKPKGRLLNLAYRNKISQINALTGKEEAEAFDNKEYLKLHMSTLRKVDIINTIIGNLEDGTLKVKPSVKQIYGLTIQGIIEIIKSSPWLLLLVSIMGYTIGTVLEPYIQDGWTELINKIKGN